MMGAVLLPFVLPGLCCNIELLIIMAKQGCRALCMRLHVPDKQLETQYTLL